MRQMRLARALCTAPTLIHTAPGATLSISGRCASLVVKTNSETDFAHASATVAGAPCEPARAGALVSNANGDISLAAADADAAILVEVPAVFDVAVAVEGACDVEVRGWLEGRVDVSTGRGRVQVGTVRGLLTRLQTEAGDVSVDHVEGNLLVETGAGDVALGKILGEELFAATGAGGISAKALYAKRAELRARGGGVRAAVLSAERGAVSADGDCALSSVDGACDVALGPAASLELQAGELLRSLRVVGDGDGGDGAGAPAIELHLPEKLHARGTLRGAAVALDDAKLAMRPLADGDDDYDPAPAAAAAATPDRTPAGASALGAAAAAASADATDAALARAAARCAARERLAFSEEGGGTLGCAIDVAAPRHTVRPQLQDFFARFKLG